MNELQIFNSEEFGDIRTVTINNEPWFVGKDVAVSLGYKDTSDALKKHVEDEDKLTRCFADSGQNRQMYIINESGLYALIFGSRLESAKRFKHWVTSEVLPAIRKNGSYQLAPQGEELLALAVIEAKKTIGSLKDQCKFLGDQVIEQQQIITELQPKANYVDKILQSKSLVTITQIAKDYGMSGRRMNQILKELKIQYKVGVQWVLYSKYQNNGYVHSRTIDITRADGRPDVTMQTEWTQKGRLFLYEELKKHGYVPVIEQVA
ncbi:phage antirepressor [[Ruminococcus] lactaris]|uniref:phage antirepressor n=1 Tax=[Ruminococcus] lactaris TaxID=46228 RepID=UPI003520A340